MTMIQDAQFGLVTLVTSDALPSWNPGDEFEAARIRAPSKTAGG